MRVLWISSLAWKVDGQYEYPVSGSGAVAGSCFEQNIIEGMEELGCEVDIIADYPYKRTGVRRIAGEYWSHNGTSVDYRLPYYDMGYASILCKEYYIRKIVREKLARSRYDVVVVYLIHHPYMTAFPLVKKLAKDTKTLLICPDLPDMMDMSLKEKAVKKFLKKIDKYRIIQKYRHVDSFVLFSDAMIERLPVADKPHITIEGVSSVSELDTSIVEKSYAVLHAGTLHKNIGIENIIQAFQYIHDKNLELWIFGDGELVDYIQEKSKEDDRIKYMGFVDRDKLFEFLKKARVLINARNPADEYTKYSFPSKMFEYIYSGTPFLTTKLNGIPNEYWEYVRPLNDNAPQTIAESILKILKEDCDNQERIQSCRIFVEKNKGKVEQGRKLFDFLQSLLIEKK